MRKLLFTGTVIYQYYERCLICFRNEIALCIEKAYDRIALSETARMLFYESVKPMKEYAKQVR